MKRRRVWIVSAFMSALFLLSGCQGASSDAAYKDGTYIGQSGEDDRGAYGEATVTIEGGQIADCQYVTWQKDGTVKDENYGKINGAIENQEFYDKAQLAVDAMKEYARQLVEVQKPEDVDVISGATISYDQFNEAVNGALDQAKE